LNLVEFKQNQRFLAVSIQRFIIETVELPVNPLDLHHPIMFGWYLADALVP